MNLCNVESVFVAVWDLTAVEIVYCQNSFYLPPQGKLTLNNEYNGNVSVFILRGVGEDPLPEDHAMLHCPVGQTTHSKLNVPNYSQKNLTVKVHTQMEIIATHIGELLWFFLCKILGRSGGWVLKIFNICEVNRLEIREKRYIQHHVPCWKEFYIIEKYFQENSFLLPVCLYMQVETDLPIVSGTPFLELGPGQNTPYVLSVSPWEQGKQTGVFILFYFCVKCTNHFLLVCSNAARMILFVIWPLFFIYILLMCDLNISFMPSVQRDSNDSKGTKPLFSCRISVV